MVRLLAFPGIKKTLWTALATGGLLWACSTAAVAQPGEEDSYRRRFLNTQAVFAGAVTLSALALTYGVASYRRQNQWQRLAFLRQATQEFENDPGVAQALSILDFEEYRDYAVEIPDESGPAVTPFKVTNERLLNALDSHGHRKRQKEKLDSLSTEADNHADALLNYYAETAIRDWFNQMLNGLEHFGYLVNSRAFSVQEVRPWLLYWVRLIADQNYRRSGTSRVYDQLYNYIHSRGFRGVQILFERFGYRILTSPYQKEDFRDIQQVDTYSTRLALSMAKASQLIYQDIKYVSEIVRYTWLGGRDMRDRYRYINKQKQDTQALLFRTDDFIILAFRGSQEIRDWYTNFNTQLRKFTIRQAGKTMLSSYQGRVHTGFFLGWASTESEVLDVIKRWQREARAVKDAKGKPKRLPLVVTGHSLGGALATVAAASLYENNVDIAGLYTFGQPRVGDRAFARQLNNNLAGRVFRFVNNNDVVPHVPPPFSIRNPLRLYSHLGAVKYFDSKGLLVANYKTINRAMDGLVGLMKGLFESGFDLISDHGMAYYISHLNHALEEEIMDYAASELNLTEGGKEAVSPSPQERVEQRAKHQNL